jgi:hypothetical protein
MSTLFLRRKGCREDLFEGDTRPLLFSFLHMITYVLTSESQEIYMLRSEEIDFMLEDCLEAAHGSWNFHDCVIPVDWISSEKKKDSTRHKEGTQKLILLGE